MWRQVGKDGDRGLSIGGLLTKYAPSGENDTQRYIDVVTRAAGLSANTKLSDLTETSLGDVIRAMQRHEGMTAGTVTFRPIKK